MSKFFFVVCFSLTFYAAEAQLLEEKILIPSTGRLILSTLGGDTSVVYGAGQYRQSSSSGTEALFLRYKPQTGQADAFRYQNVTNVFDEIEELNGYGYLLRFRTGVAWALVDSMGTVLRVTYDSINFFYHESNGIEITSDTAVLVCWSKNTLGEIFIGRFNTLFQPEWTRKVMAGGNVGFSAPVFSVCADNSMIVCADYRVNPTTIKLILMKFDAAGQLHWHRVYNQKLQYKQLLPVPGGYVLSGTVNNSNGLRNIAVFNFDSTGALISTRLFNDSLYNQYDCRAAVLFHDSLLVINGSYFDQTAFHSFIGSVNIAGAGNMNVTTYQQWNFPISSANLIESEGQLIVPFECVQNSNSGYQYLLRTDDTGTVCAGSVFSLSPQTIPVQTDTGSLAEDTVHTDFINFTWPFAKVAVNTTSATSCTVGMEEEEPAHNNLFYPNPTSGIVRMEWLPKQTQLYIYGSDGRLLDFFDAADQLTEIDLSRYPAGLYLLRLSGPHFNKAEKILLRH